jgi:hypothetical protein
MSERTVACPHADRHCEVPLMDGPLCPLCQGGVDLTGTAYGIAKGLSCPCGWSFAFNPSPARPEAVLPS